MFKLVAMSQNEAVEREATFSHESDAAKMAEVWFQRGHYTVRIFEDGKPKSLGNFLGDAA